ncbi:MAG: response regulator [Desulfobacteraceae bacterium]|nr:MAG: response regulator [Desulfobacteraceae bacterium]
MAGSVLDGKSILAVDDETDILQIVEEFILDSCPNCKIEKATNYEDGARLLKSRQWDLVLLDIMGVRGFDLLEIAVRRNMKVVMFTAHALSPEALKRSYQLGARAYLPKDKVKEIVPFLEDVIQYDYQTGWNRLMDKLHEFFTQRFESDWEKKTGMDWKEHGK